MLSQDAWRRMGVTNPRGSITCCYECHEVLMHNLIVGEEDLDMLSNFFAGKSFQDRAVLLKKSTGQSPSLSRRPSGAEFCRAASRTPRRPGLRRPPLAEVIKQVGPSRRCRRSYPADRSFQRQPLLEIPLRRTLQFGH